MTSTTITLSMWMKLQPGDKVKSSVSGHVTEPALMGSKADAAKIGQALADKYLLEGKSYKVEMTSEPGIHALACGTLVESIVFTGATDLASTKEIGESQ